MFALVLAFVILSSFAWSWSKMPQIMTDWTKKKE